MLKDQTPSPTPAPTKAPTAAPTPPPTAPKCLAEEKPEIVCVNREVILEDVTNSDEFSCKAGEMITVNLSGKFKVQKSVQDPAWYVATDGDTALTGECAVGTLNENGRYSLSGSTELSFEKDVCGDIVTAGPTTVEVKDLLISTQVRCMDDDGNGMLDIGICLSWNMDSNGNCNASTPMAGGDSPLCGCDTIEVPQITVEPEDPPILPCR